MVNVIYLQTSVQQLQHRDQKVLQVVVVKKEIAMKEVETEAVEAVAVDVVVQAAEHRVVAEVRVARADKAEQVAEEDAADNHQ